MFVTSAAQLDFTMRVHGCSVSQALEKPRVPDFEGGILK